MPIETKDRDMNIATENNADGSMEYDDRDQQRSDRKIQTNDADGTNIQFKSNITTVIPPPNFQRYADFNRVEKLRLDLFTNVEKGSCEDVRKVLEDVHTAGVNVAHPDMLDPNNDMNVLHLALDRKRMDIAEFLIKECDNDILEQVFTLPKGSRTALHQITEAGDLALVQKVFNQTNDDMAKLVLIETEFQVEDGRPWFMNAFHLAAFKGFTDIVEFLIIDVRIKVDVRTRKSNTALIWAAREGKIDTIRCLLENDANANLENDNSPTALHWAVSANQTESVKLLLDKGKAETNHRIDIGFGFPLTIASSIGNKNMVECLINKGARIKDLENEKPSALYHAAKGGHVDVVKLLLKHDARYCKDLDEDKSRKNRDEHIEGKYEDKKKPHKGRDEDNDRKDRDEDKDGNNALLIAAKTNRAEIVEKLLENGDDVTYTNNFRQDVMFFALTSGDKCLLEKIVDHLQRKTFNISELTPPVCVAARLGLNDKIESLIAMGVKHRMRDVRGNTFIHYAAQHNQNEVIKHFSHCVNLDAKNKDGDTALHVACKAGNLLAVKELISEGARTTVTNEDSENILHAAASSKSKSTKELCGFLVNNFIEEYNWDTINSRNKNGENALHIAASLADPDVIWEFRKLRYKDQDNNGNTSFHSAVRPDCEKALDKMLDIYTDTDKDVDLNIKNKNEETVMHLAVSARFKNSVIRLIDKGADLGCKDKDGNTVLHRLVKASVEDTENDDTYIQVVDLIFDNSVLWWCKEKGINIPTEDQVDKHIEFHREAILSLVRNFSNKSQLSVVAYAFKLGADKFLSKVLTMENVTHVQIENKYCYDINDITPSTSECGVNRWTFDCRACKTPRSTPKSNIERLLRCNAKDRVDRILNILPMRELEKMYSNVCTKIYLMFLILHIFYMILLTLFGIRISINFAEMARGKPENSSDFAFMCTRIIIPIEPILYSLYAYNGIMRLCKRKEKPSEFTALNLTIATLNPIITLGWIALVEVRSYYQDYVLAVTLIIGWIASISFIRYKPVHFLYRLSLHIILKDISRLLLVFGFVWMGFGTAFHVLMRPSTELSETYDGLQATLYMLFTIVVGMFEIKDDWATTMEAEKRQGTFLYGVALVYIMLGTVIMMNLLIAMMNDSFRKIYDNQQIYWRIDTLRIGLELEYLLPKKLSMFINSAMQKKSIRDDLPEGWYIFIHDESHAYNTNLNRKSPYDVSFSKQAVSIKGKPLSRRSELRTRSKKHKIYSL